MQNLTDLEYRRLNHYAVSDLNELHRLRCGLPSMQEKMTPSLQRSLQFGTNFHTMCLQPGQPVDVKGYRQTTLMRLAQMVEHTLALHGDLLAFCDCEKVVLWQDEETGLPCKAKIDAIEFDDGFPTGRLIDLKTTRCGTIQEFEASFESYGYYRQAAYYLRGHEAHTMVFIGVQKESPYSVYWVELSRNHPAIVEADRQLDHLLFDALRESLDPDGWRPSSWGKEVEV